MNVHIVDNFLADPQAERERALSATYETKHHRDLTYRGISLTDDEGQREQIALMLGLAPKGKWEVFWRRYLKSEKNETYIHNDALIGTYTAILFLNTPEQCKGGTAFWMHKLYKWSYQPTVEELPPLGLKDTPEFWKTVLDDGFDESKWEMMDYAPMAFNRLILFNSRAFHSRYPQEAFGDDTATGRLIKVFFFTPEVSQ